MTIARSSRVWGCVRSRGWQAATLALAIAALGCQPRDVELLADAGDRRSEPIAGLQSIEITPGTREATFDGKALDSAVAFRAIGKFAGGKRDVTDEVDWSLSRPEIGSIARGKLVAARGGKADVIARNGGVSATAKLTIRLDLRISHEVEADLVRAFAKSESSDRKTAMAPQIAYPVSDTVIPSNLAHLRYQWRVADTFDAYELCIDSSVARLRYYTSKLSWADDAETSRFLAPSQAGERVTIHVRALDKVAPDAIYRSDDVTIEVSDFAVPGDVYYWSSTARGIKRASLELDHAPRVVTDPSPPSAATCTGCHAISRDGKHIAVADGTDHLLLFSGPPWAQQSITEMPPPPPGMMPTAGAPAMMMKPGGAPPPMAAGTMAPPPPPPPMMPGTPKPPADYSWSSFSPDGTQLVYSAKGKLRLLDTTTGAELPKVKMGPDMSVTHPDWSPDGAFIAVTLTMGKAPKSDKLVRGSSIARIRVQDDGMLGEPEVLVQSMSADETLAFPVYSPDGRFIAYSRATGPSKDNPTAQLYVVAADGGTPILLSRASRPSGADAMSPPAAANSMPAWAPVIDGAKAFLTFSSTRDYADVLVGAQRDQLWASAIDFDVAATGKDPSAPAFWLPFQDPMESNHRALWAAAASEGCTPRAELCDDRDDDCDGKIDETCCMPSAEDCSTEGDEDCDGVSNEGCNCSDIETCGNGVDDDCDQHTDEDCMP